MGITGITDFILATDLHSFVYFEFYGMLIDLLRTSEFNYANWLIHILATVIHTSLRWYKLHTDLFTLVFNAYLIIAIRKTDNEFTGNVPLGLIA